MEQNGPLCVAGYDAASHGLGMAEAISFPARIGEHAPASDGSAASTETSISVATSTKTTATRTSFTKTSSICRGTAASTTGNSLAHTYSGTTTRTAADPTS